MHACTRAHNYPSRQEIAKRSVYFKTKEEYVLAPFEFICCFDFSINITLYLGV